MNPYSTEVYNEIIALFPQLAGLNNQESDLLEFKFENDHETQMGSIYVQTSEDDQIWIRTDHFYTTYAVDSVEELIYILGGLISNEMFWVVAYEEEEWDDSFFALKGHEIEMEQGIDYKILSWDGKEDQFIKGE